MKKHFLWLSLLLTACSPTLPRGRFESEIPEWAEGAEYPVTTYYFERRRHFSRATIFCFLYDHGAGRYRVVGDTLVLRFGSKDRWGSAENQTRDTTVHLPFKTLNDSTLEINNERFFLIKN